jgi:RNA polymerase sigma-70 factor, ECF subfamily
VNASDATEVFEAERPRLLGLAYRLLGTRADADDMVQEAWLRYSRADHATIASPAAWLTTVTSRLGIDRLRQRRRERVTYVGPWLPEPLVEPFVGVAELADTDPHSQPATSAELSDSLTTAFLVMLESLSPTERLVVLLVDVFNTPFTAVAETIDKSEAACRQIATRARRKLRSGADESGALHPTGGVDDRAERLRVAWEFSQAVMVGDIAAVTRLAAPDIVLVSDGGEHRHAARHPVIGVDRVARFMINITRRMPDGATIEPVWMNGSPAFLVLVDDEPFLLQSLDVVDGHVANVCTIVNPDKLARVRDRALLM